MNKTDETLISLAARSIEDLGLALRVQQTAKTAQANQGNSVWQLGRGKERVHYAVEVKRGLTTHTLGATLAQLQHTRQAAGRPALLVTDHVPPGLAQKLREQRQQFVDASGNAYLDTPGLLVFVATQKSKLKAPVPRGQSLTVAGLKTLFVLISDPALADSPQRAIAAAAGVALGAVPGVLSDLKDAGHLLASGRRRRMDATKRLLDQWAADYARKLRHKTLTARYTAPGFDAWPKWQIDAPTTRWGGEPAANLLVQHLKPAVLTLYTHRLAPRLQVEQRLIPAGPHAEQHVLELRRPFWGQLAQSGARDDLVPPALVYADLLATGDARCIETAQLVYDRYLARLLPDR